MQTIWTNARAGVQQHFILKIRNKRMKNFVFSIPTIAYFGKGQIKVLGETI